MPNNEYNDLKIRLDLLQETVWNNEEKISRNLESHANLETEFVRLKAIVEVLQYKFIVLVKDIDEIKRERG